MPSEDKLSDDYVASLLAKDAKDSTIKYSLHGLGGFLPKRPTTNAPKPNTRFLKNIIRETDNHNAALKAKEAEEARARLRRLRKQTEKVSEDRVDEEDGRSSKRRRVEQDDDGVVRKGRGHKTNLAQQLRDNEDHNRKRERRRTEHDTSENERGDRSSRHKHHFERRRHRSYSRNRSRDRDRHRDRRDHRHHDRSRSRSRSPRAHRGSKYRRSHRRRSPSTSSSDVASPTRKPRHERSREVPPSGSANGKPKRPRSPTPNSASDSDPLASLIGPPPPPSPPKVRSRGRGTFASNSGIDTHFSNSYDPTADIHPNSDSENDWDQALEALRDRQKWKQQGAERLRGAGFSEQEVQKWEKSGPSGEKREEDVVWKGRGEGREWDRGKVVSGSGDEEVVVTRAEWGNEGRLV